MAEKSIAPSREDWRRKLHFRSWHRGTKEMDLMLGRFADAELARFGESELALYDELLKESDPDLYEWLTGKSSPPSRCQNAVMEKLIRFHTSD